MIRARQTSQFAWSSTAAFLHLFPQKTVSKSSHRCTGLLLRPLSTKGA